MNVLPLRIKEKVTNWLFFGEEDRKRRCEERRARQFDKKMYFYNLHQSKVWMQHLEKKPYKREECKREQKAKGAVDKVFFVVRRVFSIEGWWDQIKTSPSKLLLLATTGNSFYRNRSGGNNDRNTSSLELAHFESLWTVNKVTSENEHVLF